MFERHPMASKDSPPKRRLEPLHVVLPVALTALITLCVTAGLSQKQVHTSNKAAFEEMMRDRFDAPTPLKQAALTPVGRERTSTIAQGGASANLAAQYTYSPFGERIRIAGSGPDSDFGFAGMYYHARSGLYLTPYRAYDPKLGRWLSRDPLGEHAGTNLYAYAGNNPISKTDPLGLIPSPSPSFYVPHMPLNIGSSPMPDYYNPAQKPFTGEPACYDYALGGGGNRIPPGWSRLPFGAPLQHGDAVLYGGLYPSGPGYSHSNRVWTAEGGVAASVQQIPGPGAPVVFGSPMGPSATAGGVFGPIDVIRYTGTGIPGGLFPQNAVIPGVTPMSPYPPY